MKKSGIFKIILFLGGLLVAAKVVYHRLKPQKEEVYEDIFEEEELFSAPKKEPGEIQVILAEHKEIRLDGVLKPQNYKLLADALVLDLKDTVITKDSTLKLFLLASNVTVKVPDGVAVRLEAKIFFGKAENKAQEGEPGAPVLSVEARSMLSALKIQ